MRRAIKVGLRASEQYAALDAGMQAEVREHVAIIAEDPMAHLHRAAPGRTAAHLEYTFASEAAPPLRIHLTFQLTEDQLRLILITSSAPAEDDAD